MLSERKFNIVLASKNKNTGKDVIEKFDKEVTYTGKKIAVNL